ncbi:MAG: hypothetical protein IKN15_02320 [Bacteroidaceae bacterium]|nr:hypothetical protein [Bacteroidaceae bacterium]
MSESTQNEGKTVLQLDEKTMDQLRSVGYLLVAFEGGNAKLKLASLENIVVFNFDETVGTDTAASISNAIKDGKSVFCRLDDGSLLTLRESGIRPIRYTFGDGVNAAFVMGNNWIRLDDKIKNVVLKIAYLYESNIKDGVLEVDSNNCHSSITLSTISSLVVKCSDDTVPHNFTVEIDNTGNPNAVSLSVVDYNGRTLKHSVSAGTSIAAGKCVQVNVVGNCWTMEEFDA